MYIYSRPWGLQIGLGIREEWEEDQKKRAKNNSPHFRRDSPEIQVPNQCQICNENLKNPVMTLCSHFFCEKCALGHYSKSANCFQCQKPTNGTFNGGGQTIKKLQEAKLNQQKAHALKKTGKKAAPKIRNKKHWNYLRIWMRGRRRRCWRGWNLKGAVGRGVFEEESETEGKN